MYQRKKIAIVNDSQTPPNWNPYQLYETPANAIQPMLAKIADLNLFAWARQVVLIPGCGRGGLAKHLPKVKRLWQQDIAEYGNFVADAYGNFLTIKSLNYYPTLVLMNPPFRYAQQFIQQAMRLSKRWVISLAEERFLSGSKQLKLLEQYRPRFVWSLNRRLRFATLPPVNYLYGFHYGHCWLVFDKQYDGPTTLDWLKVAPQKEYGS